MAGEDTSQLPPPPIASPETPQMVSSVKLPMLKKSEYIFWTMKMERPQVVSAAKLPILNPNEFDLWKMKIEQYFLMTNYSLWEVILNGDSPAPIRVIEGVVQPLKFNIHKDAKTLMKAIEKRFGGNKKTKKVQKTLLKQQYENFTCFNSESLDQIHDRLHKLIIQLEILGETLSQEDINLKFLRSLPTEWRTHTLIWRNKTDLEEQSLDDLFNNLKIYEAEVKSSSTASTSTQNIAFMSSNTDSTTEPVSYVASVSTTSAKIPVSALPNVDNLRDGLKIADGHVDCESKTISSEDTKESWSKWTYIRLRDGYHVVPPPYTGTFMPHKPDMVFNNALNVNETVYTAFNVKLSPIKPETDLSQTLSYYCVLKTHVIRPRQAKIVVTKPHTPSRRHINRSPSLEISNFHPEVNVVKAPMVNAVKGLNTMMHLGDPSQLWLGSQRDTNLLISCAGEHVLLSDFEEINGRYVAFGGNPKGGKISGKVKIRTGKLDFEDVNFVKELKFNLFSVSQMCDKKNNVLFTDTECIILSPEFKLSDESQMLLRVPRKNNMYNMDLKHIVPSGDLTCPFVKATLDESNLWRRRLGHINFKTMNKLVKERAEVYYDFKEPFKSLKCLWVRSKSIAATWLEKVVTPLIEPAIQGFAAASAALKPERLKVDKHDMSEPMSYYLID
nr:ribonuclease H-like domain-containing protein [Tanacetum cinerariifolium]